MKTSDLPSVILPVLNRGDLLKNALLSITDPVRVVFVIDNSGGTDRSIAGAIARTRVHRPDLNIRVFSVKYNMGYAAAMNLGFSMTPPPWITMSNDLVLSKGAIAVLMDRHLASPDLLAVIGLGLVCALITPEALRKAGTFDENFYPAYYEDLDWRHRAALSGTKTAQVEEFGCWHGGSQTLKSDPELAKKNDLTFGHNKEYFRRKWGCLPEEPTSFLTPFNDPTWPINKWVLDRQHYTKNWNIWNGASA